jgi:drug/metabolite transporter (DMT)-like permease
MIYQGARHMAERTAAGAARLPAQQPGIAFALAALTSVAWGLLPLALRKLVPVLDSYTITSLRFGVAAIVVGAWLAARGELPDPRRLEPRLRWLLAIAVLGLTINYVNFVKGVELTTPAIAQTVTQLSNIFLLLGGLVVFRERFAPLQWLGFALLMLGLALFFNDRLPQLLAGRSRLTLGVGLLTAGSLAWACYGLIQKRLLREFRATQLLWLFYVGGTLLLLPFASPLRALRLPALESGALVFCILNTIVGYGAYAEAMRRGEVARVSATVTTAPLFTLAAGWLAVAWAPSFAAPEQPNGLAILGACLVVAGCALCALGTSRRPA